jgi:hypothetical protein
VVAAAFMCGSRTGVLCLIRRCDSHTNAAYRLCAISIGEIIPSRGEI